MWPYVNFPLLLYCRFFMFPFVSVSRSHLAASARAKDHGVLVSFERPYRLGSNHNLDPFDVSVCPPLLAWLTVEQLPAQAPGTH
jgi:hypothetical protein